MDPGVMLVVGAAALVSLAGLRFGPRLRAKLVALRRAAGPQPPRIRLQAVDALPRHVERVLRPHAEALLAQRFFPVGTWTVAELGGICLQGFARIDGDGTSDSLAVVYHHPLVKRPWVDLIEEGADGGTRTISSGAASAGLEKPPWLRVVHHEGADVAALVQAFEDERLPPPRRRIDPAGLADEIAGAWAREMDWRNARGGPSLDEIRAQGGGRYSDAAVAETRRRLRAHALDGVDVALRERLTLVAPHLGPGDAFFVHDLLEADELAALCSAWLGEVEPCGPPARERFPDVVAQLPPRFRPRFVLTLPSPLPADVYERPGASGWGEEDGPADAG